jgi:hypothetical protein
MTVSVRPFLSTQENPAVHQTVQEVIDHYLADLAKRLSRGDYSEHAFQDTERELRAFAKKHGTKALGSCRRHDLTDWLDSHPEWKSNWTRLAPSADAGVKGPRVEKLKKPKGARGR